VYFHLLYVLYEQFNQQDILVGLFWSVFLGSKMVISVDSSTFADNTPETGTVRPMLRNYKAVTYWHK